MDKIYHEKLHIQILVTHKSKLDHFQLWSEFWPGNWAEIWNRGWFLGANSKLQIKNFIGLQVHSVEEKKTFSFSFGWFSTPSENVVSMATRKELSFMFWFQNITYINISMKIHKVSRKKSVFVSELHSKSQTLVKNILHPPVLIEEGCHALKEARSWGNSLTEPGGERKFEGRLNTLFIHKGGGRCWSVWNVREGGRRQANDIKEGGRLNLCDTPL